jgi:hypothetical protein
MNRKQLTQLVALLALLSALDPAPSALAQGTAFTYQGRLNDANGPANGSYDLIFTLFDTNTTGLASAGPVTNSATEVSNGLFTTTVDFGSGAFTDGSNWLEIAVSTNGADSFFTLSPRQQLTPTPYAITAGSVLSGGLASGTYGNAVTLNNAANNFSGMFSGDGSGLSSVNAYSLNGFTSASFWQVGGNAGANPTNGAFLGTTDNLPLEFWVNTNRALRLEYALDPFSGVAAAPNIIGGYAGNIASNGVAGAFIGGGGDPYWPNTVGAPYASVLGGHGNKASGWFATAIGDNCIASGLRSIAMGVHAQALHQGTFVWADDSSPSFAAFQSTTNYQFLLRAAGGVGIGTTTPPPGGLNVASGGLAVSGASSPNYHGAKGVFVENLNTYGAIYAFNYSSVAPLPLCLNTPGGNVGIGTTAPTHLFQVGNAYCDGNTWAPASDRNLKAGFQPVDVQTVLSNVAALPITSWHYNNDVSTPHLGPMAQDFYAAFKVGADDKHITTTDEGGVALAAIQGLNEKVEAESQRSEESIRKLEAENAGLKARLEKLEQLLTAPTGGAK